MFPIAKEHIMKSEESGICWKNLEMDGERSCIHGLQIFSDKSQISLSAGSLFFYPVHVTYITFMEDGRRKHISSENTVAAYLPVCFKRIHNPPALVTILHAHHIDTRQLC